jgi:hypothetical protein
MSSVQVYPAINPLMCKNGQTTPHPSSSHCISKESNKMPASPVVSHRFSKPVGLLDTIGNTPMLELKRLNSNPLARVFVKLEFVNPSGSIKGKILFFPPTHKYFPTINPN